MKAVRTRAGEWGSRSIGSLGAFALVGAFVGILALSLLPLPLLPRFAAFPQPNGARDVSPRAASGGGTPAVPAVGGGAALGTPSAPTNVGVVPHNNATNVSWSPPISTGYGPVLNYSIVWWSNQTPYLNHTVGPSANSSWIAGLRNGVGYEFEVAAANAFGMGPYSAPVPGRPGTVPGAPTLLSAGAGNGSITVQWLPANSTAGYAILAYIVRLGGNGTSLNETVPGNSTFWSGLGFVNGQSYWVTVRAGNGFGDGPESSGKTVLPAAPPSAPRNVSATWDVSTGRLVLQWSLPAFLGGVPIGNYTLSWSSSDGRSGSTHLSPRSTLYVLPSAAPGVRFLVHLAAVNSAGEGTVASLGAMIPMAGSPGPSGSPFATPLVIGGLLLGGSLLAAGVTLFLLRRRPPRAEPGGGGT